jgi:vacuolar-type H+-ATPase subunit I/STV1
MSVENPELQQLISDLSAKEKRERKRYWVYTLIALAAGIAWLAYSFLEVRKLREESQNLRNQISQQRENLVTTTKELDARNDELQTVAQNLRIPFEELQNLKNFEFLSGAQNNSDLHAYVEQSNKAKAELQNIKSLPTEKARRANISIRYYVRESDNGRVARAIDSLHNDYGFTAFPNPGQKEPNTYTNAIWINRNNLTAEDVKLIAYYLILRGIQIKYIGLPSSKAETVKRVVHETIVVVAEPKAKEEPSLSVDKLKDMSLSSLLQGTKTLNW